MHSLLVWFCPAQRSCHPVRFGTGSAGALVLGSLTRLDLPSIWLPLKNSDHPSVVPVIPSGASDAHLGIHSSITTTPPGLSRRDDLEYCYMVFGLASRTGTRFSTPNVSPGPVGAQFLGVDVHRCRRDTLQGVLHSQHNQMSRSLHSRHMLRAESACICKLVWWSM